MSGDFYTQVTGISPSGHKYMEVMQELAFLMSKKDIHRVKECKIELITISDHSPVIIKADLAGERSILDTGDSTFPY